MLSNTFWKAEFKKTAGKGHPGTRSNMGEGGGIQCPCLRRPEDHLQVHPILMKG